MAGYFVTGSTIEAGDSLILNKDGATDCTVEAGGTLDVYNYSTAQDDLIHGNESVEGGSTVTGETVYAGGTITAGFEGVVRNTTVAGGTLVEASGGYFEGVTFSGSGGHLELNIDGAGEILGFGVGDSITVINPTTASLSVSGDTVVFDGVTLDIVGASGDNLVINYSNGGALECACFLPGTLIAVPGGARPIETLAAGDLVLTDRGEAQPIRWVGRQTVATRFADLLRVAPIRIRAGALGEHLPARDLFVSPDHALLVDDVFVQAGALVNGVSITREQADLPETFLYLHIELADHSLILAEGVPAETFIDNAGRLAFDNSHEHAALGGDTAPMREMPHARAKSHRQVPPALRARLLARAGVFAAAA